jgi:sugar phosphate isomerase/epimerase
MLENCIISGFADEIDKSVAKQIKVLKDLGQNYVEFRSGDGKGIAEYTLEEAIVLKKTLDEAGIKVSAIGSPIGKIKITEDFTDHFELYKHVVELAHILDTHYIRMFSFYIPSGHNPEDYKEEVFLRIDKMVEYAKENGVILLHENEKDIYGDIASRCEALMGEFYGEHFKLTFDFANFIQCNEDTLEAFHMLKPYIHYVHIKDALCSNHEVVLPGKGDGNIYSILNMLDDMGYDGFLSLEPHLVDFSGLDKLEVRSQSKKLEDGAYAYSMAYEGLVKLIK